MSDFYSIDSTRVSHREYWWGTRSPAVLIGWLTKWLHIRIPSSTDDPNVESTLPFIVQALPAEIVRRFEPLAAELAALGFVDPVYHFFQDAGTSTTIFWATFRHGSGQHFARIHHRVWHQAKPADRGVFLLFFTAFEDGTFAVSSSGKPDLDTPPTVQMLRRPRAAMASLWSEHVEFVAANRQSSVRPVRSREELLAASERHHLLLRDFNLARGVFRPRSGSEKVSATAVAARLEEATAAGLQHPGVLAEVERIQTHRPGWGNAIVILVVSIFAFVAAGSSQQDWKFYLWLIPLLLLHEGGHWLAMKIFGYRNLRMFFIPLFGAAVTGQHWNVPGWKKAIVSLAGPVPGILLGAALTVAGLITHHEWLNHAAFLLLIINGFNLLPVLPLDGGHVMHAILFCRNRWLDITFRVLAIMGLLLLAVSGTGRFLMYVAILMAIGLPVAFKIGKVADALRKDSLPPPLEGEDRIPLSTADRIVSALKAELPGKTNDKTLALHTVNVFESLNARPPGVLGTLGFMAVHGGSVLLVVICGFLLVLNKHGGGLEDFARTAMRQPEHSVECGSIERWSGAEADRVPYRNVLAATLEDRTTAKRQFVDLRGRLPAQATLTLVGDSLLVTLPAADDAGRERWFDALQAVTTNVFVALTNQSLRVSLMAIASSGPVATNVVEELNEYFQVSHFGGIVAPWSSPVAGTNYGAARRARQMWHAIGTNTATAWSTEAGRALTRQIVAARKRGAAAEVERLLKEQLEVGRKAENAIYDGLRTQGFDSELIDFHSQLQSLGYTNQSERAAIERQVAVKLGPAAKNPGATRLRDGAVTGFARQQGLLLELGWLGFEDASTDLPALIEWLCRQGCDSVTYDILSTVLDMDDFSE